MNRLLRPFLAASGYRIVRDGSNKRSALTAGNHVEMIGPPGAGKTTTMNLLGKNVLKSWLTREDLKFVPLSSRRANYGNIHKKLLLKRLERIDAESDSYRAAQTVGYLSKIIMNDLKIIHNDLAAGVLLDEGVSQVCKQELLGFSDAEFSEVMGRRIIISLLPRDPQVVVEQQKKRFFHKYRAHLDLPDSLLEDKVQKSVEACKAVGERAKAHNLRVVEITVEDGTVENVETLGRVLDQLHATADVPERPSTHAGST